MNENSLQPVFVSIKDAIEKYTLKKFVNPEENLTSANLQKMLLNLLKKYGLENKVGLYKATNNNLSQYSKITTDGAGNIIETPCP